MTCERIVAIRAPSLILGSMTFNDDSKFPTFSIVHLEKEPSVAANSIRELKKAGCQGFSPKKQPAALPACIRCVRIVRENGSALAQRAGQRQWVKKELTVEQGERQQCTAAVAGARTGTA